MSHSIKYALFGLVFGLFWDFCVKKYAYFCSLAAQQNQLFFTSVFLWRLNFRCYCSLH
ncbi:hypothetical protein CRENPOLYSF2_1190006 [Crenothrix polyspora]|uniref:Uncharacterized protein n=1 Tax=Crenothrix polyspora TaxID=360316 RepID=A0A1R4GZR8_9GAMM|nr:hypothetical protein CRENPOLYSF2_1190006 [Crenothrix polyspora]